MEESAKIRAELKAKKAAKEKEAREEAAKDPLAAAEASAKRDNDMQDLLEKKEEKAEEAKLAGLKRKAEDAEKKAISFAKKAVASGHQFMIRAKAEKKGMTERDIYRDKVVLHETGATNVNVLENVEKATEFLNRANEARLAAGMEPIEMTVDRRGKPMDVVAWIMEKGR
jgi:monoamine oxidase